MSEVIQWQDSPVDVKARLIPRFLWSPASIDVFLGRQPEPVDFAARAAADCLGEKLPFTFAQLLKERKKK